MSAPDPEPVYSRVLPMGERIPPSREALLAVPFEASDWSYVGCFKVKDDLDTMWMLADGWGRIIDGEHVCLLCKAVTRGGYDAWQLYANGEMVNVFSVANFKGSAGRAIEAAERWLAERR